MIQAAIDGAELTVGEPQLDALDDDRRVYNLVIRVVEWIDVTDEHT